MTDRPIIFSAPMVRALLEGRKTQTRRLLRSPMPAAPDIDAVHPANANKKLHPAPYFDAYCGAARTTLNPRGMTERWCWWTRDDRQCLPTIRIGYVPGDRLWVREAFARVGTSDPGWLLYRASGYERECARHGFDKPYPPENSVRWSPSIHMPRWASRLTLTVTDVRAQRLQEITEEDARAEGARAAYGEPFATDSGLTDRRRFQLLWDTLHGPGAWDANPHVVALTFTVAQRNIDA